MAQEQVVEQATNIVGSLTNDTSVGNTVALLDRAISSLASVSIPYGKQQGNILFFNGFASVLIGQNRVR